MTLKSMLIEKLRSQLVKGCDQWIVKFDPLTGKFLAENGGWAVTNQDNIFLLAYLYLTEFEGNPYFGEKKYLDIIKAGGDALRAAQREDGQVLFIKTDGSVWGYIYMPWSMFHWLQTYDLMQNHLDTDTLSNWKEGLILAYDGIMKSLKSMHIHNIPVWNSAAIYRAGVIFDRADYKDIADQMIKKTLEVQHPDGYWAEHEGPTLSYNAVYIYALAAYKFYGGPVNVDDALQKSFTLQQASIYPDGSLVETADGRVKYDGSVRTSDLLGYLELEGGYKYINYIIDKVVQKNQPLNDRNLNILRYLEGLPEFTETDAEPMGISANMKICHGNIQVLRDKGWQINLSSYTAPITENRWGMDRQMFVSVWHEGKGLLVGGGNTKYIPKWSTFCVADGDRILYVPQKGEKYPDDNSIKLYYEDTACSVKVLEITDNQVSLEYKYEAGSDLSSVEIGLPLKFSCDPVENNFEMDRRESVSTIRFKGYEISFSNRNYALKWPVEPFNPYEEKGRSPAQYWAAVLNINITCEKSCIVTIKKL